MFVADGGGGGTAPAPDYSSGPQTLHVELDSLPRVKDAFMAARDRVKTELDKLNNLECRDWAGDPVSAEATTKFAARTSTDAESARAVLEGYHKQLDGVVESLNKAYQAYSETEANNAALWGKS